MFFLICRGGSLRYQLQACGAKDLHHTRVILWFSHDVQQHASYQIPNDFQAFLDSTSLASDVRDGKPGDEEQEHVRTIPNIGLEGHAIFRIDNVNASCQVESLLDVPFPNRIFEKLCSEEERPRLK